MQYDYTLDCTTNAKIKLKIKSNCDVHNFILHYTRVQITINEPSINDTLTKIIWTYLHQCIDAYIIEKIYVHILFVCCVKLYSSLYMQMKLYMNVY